MRTGVVGVIALGLLTAACGTNEQQRAATGGLTGLGAGAIIGGPVGAAVGAAAGTVGGVMMPEDATSIANNLLGREHRAANDFINGNRQATASTTGAGSSAYAGTPATAAPSGLVKEAQTKLKDQGLYHAAVDGIAGPKTRNALRAYQKREGLTETAQLDRATAEKLGIEANTNTASAPSTAPQAPASGSSNPNTASAPDASPQAPASGSSSPTGPATPNSNTPHQ